MLKIIDTYKTIAGSFSDYFGKRQKKAKPEITDSNALQTFLETRASHVAQTALYGYIRTRAGSRFPELFENDEFVAAINIAKWQMWVACLSDLSTFAGGLIFRHADTDASTVSDLMTSSVQKVLDATGIPDEAGERFEESVAKLSARIEAVDWSEITDDEACFTESPAALVYWAPIVDELKELDSEIVLNSVRFRWQEVRRDYRQSLNAQTLIVSLENG